MSFMSNLFGGGKKTETPTLAALPSVPSLKDAEATVRADEVKRKIKRTKTILTDEETLGDAPVAGKSLLGE